MRDVDRIDTAIVGAGPFGLSVAAHASRNGSARTFGEPMRTWRAADAAGHAAALGLGAHEPLGARRAQARSRPGCGAGRPSASSRCRCSTSCATPSGSSAASCPRAIRATSRGIALADGGVRVTTAAGDEVQARAAVLALGVTPFPRVPAGARALATIRASASCSSAAATTISPASAWPSIGAGNNGVESALLALRAAGRERRADRALARALVRRARAAHAARRRCASGSTASPTPSSASARRRSTASRSTPTPSPCCRTRCARASTRACCVRAPRPGCARTSTA